MSTQDHSYPDGNCCPHRPRRTGPWRIVILAWTVGGVVAHGQDGLPTSARVESPSVEQASHSAGDAASTATKPPAIRIVRNVVYALPDGLELRADLYLPPEAEGRRPAVLLIHGGGWRYGTKAQMFAQARQLARRGYVAMSINYRLAPAYPYPAQVQDCLSAVRWLRRHADRYQIDPARIGVYGYSAGGHLACMVGVGGAAGDIGTSTGEAEVDARVQAVVAGGAPCDFRSMPADSDILDYWLGGARQARPATYEVASPISAVSADDPPTFFFHGEKDWVVPIFIARRMQAALSNAGVETEFFVCEGDGHVNAFTDRKARESAQAFLDRVLQP